MKRGSDQPLYDHYWAVVFTLGISGGNLYAKDPVLYLNDPQGYPEISQDARRAEGSQCHTSAKNGDPEQRRYNSTDGVSKASVLN